ncbi:adenylate/guanylate cyclase domain-containing protein [Poritiphilus flavus]|uniref:Adenylate/guanylate cyclase domain-containing protein n=1 Tax=Poritiphilus flavus TaxID=2697053 RepID=A0A6L9EGQ8_9FLAO|nr:adenylate/guanylate cyclase domain-containing protein [Poritiphilus flavus]NAS13708.1 adenylate/guanylate cyclase domain-containing protein [Poritiphilus flavus]
MEKGILGDHPVYPSTGNPYDANIIISVLTSLAVGLTIGSFEVLYVNNWFKNRSFFEKIFFKSVVYTFAIIVAALIIIVLGHSVNQGLSPFSATVWSFVLAFFSNFAFWSIICFYSLAIVICLFYKEVSDNMGQSVSYNFFTGKYHQPKSEYRVFMFLDMKSSTAHAERLGNIRYFEMLKEYYDDISQPILKCGGEIYQYVGDEIVVTWKAKNDFAKSALDCFFDMKKALSEQHPKYLAKYNVAPTFKAGLHYGKVTTGEIGLLKKDIVFTGDTLNTTARIQSLCNQYEAELLVSDVFLNAMKSKGRYDFKSLGEVQLRGRNQTIGLFSVHQVKLNQ